MTNNKTFEEEVRGSFEANMLDGDSIDDCGKALIDAKECFDFLLSKFSAHNAEVVGKIKSLKIDDTKTLLIKEEDARNETIDEVLSILQELK